MHRWRNSLLILFTAAVCIAQSPVDLITPDMKRVGDRLACLCKSCKNTVATCQMLYCHYTHPAREKIVGMQAKGAADQQIVDAFVKDQGLQALAVPPAEGFNRLAWIMPFAVLIFGAFAIWLYIKRYRRSAPEPVRVSKEQLSRVQEQMEKELAKLD